MLFCILTNVIHSNNLFLNIIIRHSDLNLVIYIESIAYLKQSENQLKGVVEFENIY